MVTLPINMQAHYYAMLYEQKPGAACDIIKGFFEAYSVPDAEEELWLMLGGVLTSNQMIHTHLPEERLAILSFYEHMKVLVEAVHFLHAGKHAITAAPIIQG